MSDDELFKTPRSTPICALDSKEAFQGLTGDLLMLRTLIDTDIDCNNCWLTFQLKKDSIPIISPLDRGQGPWFV
jgi:hypothetical protein